MPRGQKTCKNCGLTTGPRAYTCGGCGTSFDVDKGASKRKVKKKGVNINWHDLEKDDFIRVTAGTGPYWPLKNGENEPMGYYGKFKVIRIEKDGIHARPIDKKNSGHCFIYMGKDRMAQTGMHKCPHTVRKLTHKPRITNPLMARSV